MELPQALHRFDDAEQRLGTCLRGRVERLALRRLQPMRHGLNRRRVLRCLRRLREPLSQRRLFLPEAIGGRPLRRGFGYVAFLTRRSTITTSS
jgi:hypothetical protein